MSDIDFSKFANLSLDTASFTPPSINYGAVADQMQENIDRTVRAVEESRAAREAEELRRHNELVAALKEAGEKGATIVVGDNARGIQIQNNSAGATQTMTYNEGLNYEQVKAVLLEIKEYFDFPQFACAFGENTDNVKNIVEETLTAVENKEDEGIIKKSLKVLRSIAGKVMVSLITSGILALLETIPL